MGSNFILLYLFVILIICSLLIISYYNNNFYYFLGQGYLKVVLTYEGKRKTLGELKIN